LNLDEPLDETAGLVPKTTRAYPLNHCFDMMRLHRNNALIKEFKTRMRIRPVETEQSSKSEDSAL